MSVSRVTVVAFEVSTLHCEFRVYGILESEEPSAVLWRLVAAATSVHTLNVVVRGHQIQEEELERFHISHAHSSRPYLMF